MPLPYTGAREQRIVGVGALTKTKNWLQLIEACETIFKIHPEYILEIYGEGPEKSSLKEFIDGSSILKNRVVLKGFSSNVWNEIATAKVYVSSSLCEGISNSMIEAMALGIPTICTDCPIGGARMIIKNYENGLLVPINDVEALITSIIRVIEDPSLAKKLSEKAIEIRKTLLLRNILSQWEEEVRKVGR